MIRKNIIANYMGACAAVAAPVLALPFYISILGPKQFGLISFVTTLQVFLSLLESGISQVSLREFSVRMNNTIEGRYDAATLLFGFEIIYWGLAVGAAFFTLLFAGIIADHWLMLDAGASALGKQAVYGASVIFMVQFPGALYRSLHVGAQAQVRLNIIMVSGVLFRHVGGILFLMIRPMLSTYLIWQAVVALAETLVRQRSAWTLVQNKRSQIKWSSNALSSVWPKVAKMSGVVLLGALTTQLDKIILSRMVPIEQFGYYAIASTVALGVLNLISPLVQAVCPNIMQSHNKPVQLHIINLRLAKMISVVVLIGTVCYLIGGNWFLRIWLRNLHTVAMVRPLLAILLVGSVLNAFYHVGYFNWLAFNRTGRILFVNSTSIVFCLLLTPILVNRYGMIGATLSFVAMNAIGLVISLEWAVRLRGVMLLAPTTAPPR